MKICKEVTCPSCGVRFKVCFSKYATQLTYGAICPVCDDHFPVEL